MKHFKKQLKVFEESSNKMTGGGKTTKKRKTKGKKKDDDDSSDSDDLNSSKNKFNSWSWTSPISYFYYDPIVYGFDDVYLPNIVGSYPLINYYTGLGMSYVDILAHKHIWSGFVDSL